MSKEKLEIDRHIESSQSKLFLGYLITPLEVLLTLEQWQAVFLAYYLNSDTFPGASPIDFAFVGGLSISIGKPIISKK